MEGGGKRKLTRKQQIRALALAKKQRREERAGNGEERSDEDFEMEDSIDIEDDNTEEEVGAASVREEAARRQRRRASFVRGVNRQAQGLASWLICPEPAVEPAFAEELLALRVAEAAAAEAKRAAELAAQRAQKASKHRDRYGKRKAAEAASTPPPREVRSRLGSTLSSSKKRERDEEGASSSLPPRKLRKRVSVEPSVVATIVRICDPKKRRFEKRDIINGEMLSRVEWAQVRSDHLELRKVYAMGLFLRFRKDGMDSRLAYEEAAMSCYKPNGKPVNWQTVRTWLFNFVRAGGKLRLDQRGRSSSTSSYLCDNAIKEKTLEWLREQMRLTRAKSIDSPPLTVNLFHQWINKTLLKEKLDANPTLKLLTCRSAGNWLHSMGFNYLSSCSCAAPQVIGCTRWASTTSRTRNLFTSMDTNERMSSGTEWRSSLCSRCSKR